MKQQDMSAMTVTIRMPGETRAVRYTCGAPVKSLPDGECFVLARFNAAPLLYPILSSESFIPEAGAPRCGNLHHCDAPEDKGIYCRSLRGLINELATERGKTVISRAIHMEGSVDPSAAFARLVQAYPDAAVFSWTSGEDVWLGATPELLLHSCAGHLTTMSLAGTREAGSAGPWDAKNIEEQVIVTRFISGVLTSLALEPKVGDRYERQAGPVEHLCTEVSAALPPSLSPLAIACALSPTPAVAGYPRADALRRISRIEPHDREYYAGYFGLAAPGSTRLFVTLRCMKISPGDRICIYAGGGITPLSSPLSEWAETEKKASTLLQII